MDKYNCCKSYLFKKECSYKNGCVFLLHDVDLEQHLITETNDMCICCPFHFHAFYSRLSLRILKDANSFMFSWCIATSSLTICYWYDMATYQMSAIYKYYLCTIKFLINYTKSIISKTVSLYCSFSFKL